MLAAVQPSALPDGVAVSPGARHSYVGCPQPLGHRATRPARGAELTLPVPAAPSPRGASGRRGAHKAAALGMDWEGPLLKEGAKQAAIMPS